MSTVKIAEKKLWVDETAIPLFSGEVHYWRLDPANWRPVLRRAREMGLQIIATYVCWDFHEIEPGRYDFLGETDPRRNLLAFLDLLTSEGFWIILRPGPYIYSECAIMACRTTQPGNIASTLNSSVVRSLICARW